MLTPLGKNRPSAESVRLDAVIPVFGTWDMRALPVVVEALVGQRGLEVHVQIGCEERLHPEVERACGCARVRVTGVHDRFGRPGGQFIPGVYRNAAAMNSDSDLLYSTDADVVLHLPHYLRQLVDEHRGSARLPLCRPPMVRVPVRDVPGFLHLAKRTTAAAVIGELDRNDRFFMSLGGQKVEFLAFHESSSAGKGFRRLTPAECEVGRQPASVTEDDRVILFLADDFERWQREGRARGTAPKYSTQDRHCGGTLLDREHFLSIGGYSMSYRGWGNHDKDFQSKLTHVKGCRMIPREARFTVLHLDHLREHFCPDQWGQNRTTLWKRGEDIECAIASDKAAFRSLQDQLCAS